MKRSEELSGANPARLRGGARTSHQLNTPLDEGRPSSTGRAWLQIDLGCLEWNIAQMRRGLSSRTRLLAVVKADAYGHGATAVSRCALGCGVDILGVATVEEGLELRAQGIAAPVLILGYTAGVDCVRCLLTDRLTPTICSATNAREITDALETLASDAVIASRFPLACHVKVDTGLSRLGASPGEARELFEHLAAVPHLVRVAGVSSHLACADDPDPRSMLEQGRRFDSICSELPFDRRSLTLHLANSAATLTSNALQYDMVRLGLALYGMYPAPHLRALADLRPLLEVKARVTQVRNLRHGDGVSYGNTFVADRDMQIAAVSIGFADGVPWKLSRRMEVLIHGQRCRQLGRITMDQLIVDVSRLPYLAPGDEVTLIGGSGDEVIRVEDWAEELGTIPWEVLCLFKSRLPRVAIFRPPPLDEFIRASGRTRLSKACQVEGRTTTLDT